MARGALLGAAAVAFALALGAGPGSSAAEAKGPIAGATIHTSIRGASVPRPFLGVSLDYLWLPLYTGIYSGAGPQYGPNRLTASLLRRLTPRGGSSPMVRFGSGGADNIWWNPERRPKPPGIYDDLRPEVLHGLKEFQQLARTPLMMGLNLALNRPEEAARMAAAGLVYLPRTTFFELGNEPDIYTERNWRPDGRGGFLPPRKAPYRFGRYLREFGRHLRRLRALRPRPRIVGPAAGLGSRDAWLKGLPRFMRRFGGQVKAATYHAYPFSDCAPPSAPDHPTIPRLLNGALSRAYGARFIPLPKYAARRKRPVILSETGSAACGGKPGVSDSFAAALWGLDWLFLMHATVMRGVYFQMAAPYSPFNITSGVGSPPRAEVLPLYYAMWMFARATEGRTRSVWAQPHLRAQIRSRANVVIWAMRGRGGEVRVVVMNKDLRKSGRVRIRLRGGRRAASLLRLEAPSARSKFGVTLGGQTFGSSTVDGEPTGRYEEEAVIRRGRDYVFRMPRTSAALLIVPPRR